MAGAALPTPLKEGISSYDLQRTQDIINGTQGDDQRRAYLFQQAGLSDPGGGGGGAAPAPVAPPVTHPDGYGASGSTGGQLSSAAGMQGADLAPGGGGAATGAGSSGGADLSSMMSGLDSAMAMGAPTPPGQGTFRQGLATRHPASGNLVLSRRAY